MGVGIEEEGGVSEKDGSNYESDYDINGKLVKLDPQLWAKSYIRH